MKPDILRFIIGIYFSLILSIFVSSCSSPDVGEAEEAADPEVEKYIAQLRDSDLRSEAASALVKIGNPAVSSLIKVLKDEDLKAIDSPFGVRYEAAWALGEIGDARAIGPLIEALKEFEEQVPQEGAEDLEGQEAERGYESQVLTGVPIAAFEALKKIGEPAFSPLLEVQRDRDLPLSIRSLATFSLWEIGGEKAIEPLIGWLREGQFYMGAVSVPQALAAMGEPAVPPLIGLLVDDKALVNARAFAAGILGEIGDDSAVEALIETLKNDDIDLLVRQLAARALGDIGDDRAVDSLNEALESSDEELRKAAAEALEKIR